MSFYGTPKSRILSGISANLVGQVLVACMQLVGIPIFISTWGKDYYGEWLILCSIPSYLGMSDLGLGTVATTEIAMCISRGDTQQASKLFRAAFWSINLVGIGMCLLFLLAMFVSPWHVWLNLHKTTPDEAFLTMGLLTLYVLGTIVLTLPLGLYRVAGHYGRGQIVSYIFRFIEFLAVVMVVLGGNSMWVAAAAMVFVRIIFVLSLFPEARKLAPWLVLFPDKWDFKAITHLLSPSISITAVYFGQALINQGLVTIIGVVGSAANAVVFSTIRTLCNVARQIIGSVNLSVFSEFSISIGKGDLVAAQRLHVHSAQANFVLTLIAVLGLKIAGSFILYYWTKGQVSAIEPFFSFYLMYLLFNSLWSGSWNMLIGSNQHKGLTRYFLLSNIGALILIYIGLKTFDLTIIPIVLCVSDIVFALFVFKSSAVVLQQNTSEMLKGFLAIRPKQ